MREDSALHDIYWTHKSSHDFTRIWHGFACTRDTYALLVQYGVCMGGRTAGYAEGRYPVHT